MSRSYSHIGLKEEAEIWIEQNMLVAPECCSKCGHVISKSTGRVKYGEEEVWFDQTIDLYEYQLKDGKIAKEVFQDIPWASGPVGFQCLEVDGKRMFEWTKEEIQSHL